MNDGIKQFINALLESMGSAFPRVLGALLVLVVGLIIASLVRSGISRVLAKVKIDEKLKTKTGEPFKIESFLSNLAYYVFLLYILLLTLDLLGIKGVLDPVNDMFKEFFAMFPNLLAAVLIGFVGFFIAKIVSSAATVLTKGLDTLSPKIGLSKEFSLSSLFGQVLFLIIFVPILISALDALKIEAISVPAIDMLAALLSAIPKIIAAGLILGIAYVVGRFIMNIVAELLHNLGADNLPKKIGISGVFDEKLTFSRFCGGLVFVFLILAAAVSAVDKLEMPQLSQLLTELLVFAGHVALGLVILTIGTLIANVAYRALNQTIEKSIIANIARIAILGLVLAIGLRAMGIADDIVNLAFSLTLGAVAVGFALSFGLGGREAAGKQMDYWLGKLRKSE